MIFGVDNWLNLRFFSLNILSWFKIDIFNILFISITINDLVKASKICFLPQSSECFSNDNPLKWRWRHAMIRKNIYESKMNRNYFYQTLDVTSKYFVFPLGKGSLAPITFPDETEGLSGPSINLIVFSPKWLFPKSETRTEKNETRRDKQN